MLRLLRSFDAAPRSDPRENIFIKRYAQILTWATQLSGGDPQHAEDLVQDAYVYLVNSRPDFSQARNIEAYLYGILRNLRRAQLHRAMRLRSVPLSIVDFDSAQLGLRVLQDEDLVNIQNDLRRICHFACYRKETSRSGSVLILRFFHGYYPSEIAAILRSSRPAVEERLRQARRELQIYLPDPSKLEVLGERRLEPAPARPMAVTTDAFLAEIRERIFRSSRGPCIGRSELGAVYRNSSTSGPNHATLAHMVSCRSCLDAVNALLRLSALEDRDPSDSTGNDPGQPPPQRPSRRKMLGWKRRAGEVLEHEPKQLIIAVNGQPLGSNLVVAEDSEFAVSIALNEEIEFLEVWSEQQVRLLLWPVCHPAKGRPVQTTELALSDGRLLTLRLSFASPWPEVCIRYYDPLIDCLAVERAPRREPRFSLLPATAGWLRPIWTPILAMLLAGVLLFVQTRETTLSAAVVLDHVAEWERVKESTPSTVLHRTFTLTEHRRGQSVVRRRLEVWRSPKAKLSRLSDESGRPVLTARLAGSLPPFDPSNAWQFEPAADTFRALAKTAVMRAIDGSAGLELVSPAVDLIIDKATYRPISETIHAMDGEFEFHELGTETLPEGATPLAPPAPKAAAKITPGTLASEPGTRQPLGPSPSELDAAEVAAWVALHSLGADLGEDVHVRRREGTIEVSGFLDTGQRKAAVTTALENIPNLILTLHSPEDLWVARESNQQLVNALATFPEAKETRSPVLEKWLEQNYPDAAERRAWVTRVVDLSRDCLRRSYALHELGSRFPSPGNAEILRVALEDEQQLSQSWEQLTTELRNALGEASPSNPVSMSWHDTVFATFDRMKVFELQVLDLFAADASGRPVGDAATELEETRTAQMDLAALITHLSQSR
jgi:RNA polymerase sigma factor (sigma-70 family)